jgi:hypothetical protein
VGMCATDVERRLAQFPRCTGAVLTRPGATAYTNWTHAAMHS